MILIRKLNRSTYIQSKEIIPKECKTELQIKIKESKMEDMRAQITDRNILRSLMIKLKRKIEGIQMMKTSLNRLCYRSKIKIPIKSQNFNKNL